LLIPHTWCECCGKETYNVGTESKIGEISNLVNTEDCVQVDYQLPSSRNRA